MVWRNKFEHLQQILSVVLTNISFSTWHSHGKDMLISIALGLVAFIVGIVENKCDTAMSVWMLIFATWPFIIFCCVCCVVFQLALTAELTLEDEETKEMVVSLGIVVLILGALSFHTGWLVYGCILFWSEASDHPCRTLVIVSTPHHLITCKYF